MADDRVRIKVDGMDLIASCPNHMNSPLSYIDPTNVGSLQVLAGITPVSAGGDSIGGSIIVNSPAPEFAGSGQPALVKGEIGTFYRSNGNGKGANLSATYATDAFNLTYSASTAESDNYKAAGNFKNFDATGRTGQTLPRDEVGSTAYKTRNQSLAVALKGDNSLVELKVGYQDVPFELYPNQRMDMLANTEHSVNLRYLGQFAWGSLEARGYHETVKHYMNFGADKQLVYGTAINGMPMDTEGTTNGAVIKANVDLGNADILRLGSELQQYTLNDWWPPSGTGMMAPGTFQNINNGTRDRMAFFSEWEFHSGSQWLNQLGARYERVTTNAGPVVGYAATNMMGSNQLRDSNAFNATDRKKSDNNFDLTALSRYTADANRDYEIGFARKVRSPNLYERYSWSTWSMAAVMNNFVGDGNGYVGDPNLKPEVAHTLSGTFSWHTTGGDTEIRVTPYYTRVTDYIDAIQWNTTTNAPATALSKNLFGVLKYVNQSARIYGMDLSGKMPIASTTWGDFGLKGLLNYTRGKNLDTDGDLYNIMPLNSKVTLWQKLDGWDNALELVMVDAKDNVSAVRNEIRTPGYSLVNLRASYSWQKIRLDFGVENLFDKLYALPLGGAYAGQGMTMSMNGIPWGIQVPGQGRSLYAGLNIKF